MDHVPRRKRGAPPGWPRRKPIQLSRDQKAMVLLDYIKGDKPAWDVARALGPEWGQSDVYSIAKRLREKLGIPFVRRTLQWEKYDYALIDKLRDEAMTWAEIAEFVGAREPNIKSLYHHHRKRGDFQ